MPFVKKLQREDLKISHCSLYEENRGRVHFE